MRIFNTWQLSSVFIRIESARREGIKFEIDCGNRDTEVSKEFQQTWIEQLLKDARDLATKGELESTDSRVNPNGGLSLALERGLTYQELDYELKVLRESIQVDLSDKHVYIVENEKQKYNTQEFILETWGRAGFYFPGIRKDATAAMRAYVYGLNTACVFHLMRISEVGLRSLARRMRVTLPKRRQLEWAQWNDILMAMSKKTEPIASRRPTHARDELLEFYRGAIAEFQGYKDAYRNFIMHMREKINYDTTEARSLIDRVSHFMTRLSDKIDERGLALTEARVKKMLAQIDAKIEEEKRKTNEQAKQGIREIQHSDAATSTSTPQQTQRGTGIGEAEQNQKAEA